MSEPISPEDTRCGFVALIGAPNAGKSTLLNQLVGTKVSIVSRKVQTTRTQIRGIAIEGNSQIIFVDTPGIFRPKRRLDRAMVGSAWGGAGDADVVCLLIDARRGVTMFKKVAVPILGVIENMATFVCPNCGHASHIFGHGGARHEAQRLGVPFLGEVPLNMTIRETSDAGRPVVATDPDGPQAVTYREIAAKLWAGLSGAPATRAAPKIVFE